MLELLLQASLAKIGSILEGELQKQPPPVHSFLNGSLQSKAFTMGAVLDLSDPVYNI